MSLGAGWAPSPGSTRVFAAALTHPSSDIVLDFCVRDLAIKLNVDTLRKAVIDRDFRLR